ncbi:DinB family protein [Mucilaginibacter limnophilus]|uniref:DinB family protein n=1 Tax=Mucilaginibacter limnophilus TaxID=1932778 RepID=A0A437MKL2_9SPHI|nr:DinB family protein [Mucilaginibacter limnophilus]RVT98190.1 DinB family protein [Mucilaginibacter limnophilus]
MLKAIEILYKPRTYLVKLIEGLTIEQLNQIPTGFNNNIIWNFAHMIAAQQGVCYIRAGLKTVIDEDLYMAYKPETKPEKFVDAAELDTIKQLAFFTLDKLEEDYHAGIFGGYIPWTTRYGVDINNIDEAIKFLPFHDGLHTGYIMAQRRALLR